MIAWICVLLLLSATVFAAITGNLSSVSQALLESPASCVTLLLKIGGSICLFSGLMRVAEKSGLVDLLSRALRRPVEFLMPQTRGNPTLRSSVTMNLASNFFGLGNAATPYGIQAAGEFSKKGFSSSLAVFMILNTCSVQLIPTTVCALRQANGSENPLDILPAVWIVQILSCTFGILLCRWAFRRSK